MPIHYIVTWGIWCERVISIWAPFIGFSGWWLSWSMAVCIVLCFGGWGTVRLPSNRFRILLLSFFTFRFFFWLSLWFTRFRTFRVYKNRHFTESLISRTQLHHQETVPVFLHHHFFFSFSSVVAAYITFNFGIGMSVGSCARRNGSMLDAIHNLAGIHSATLRHCYRFYPSFPLTAITAVPPHHHRTPVRFWGVSTWLFKSPPHSLVLVFIDF